MKQAQSVSVDTSFEAMTAADAPSCWNYQHIIDSRSPAEFALDHVPGAVNWPVLDSAQRESVGTLYQREGSFKAKLAGATLVARNIASLIEDRASSIDPHARLLVYCWRGGNRSGALSTVLARIGFRTDVLEGGYKAFRRWVIEDTARRAQGLKFCIVAGRTGSAKTDLLHLLAQEGEQVID
ncbi:MAG: tRNA 2-selenouridine(34) synthase MnmH, partial [Betaproteobacteria bacterium]|nr:tRNA 2-selenouridine(34) synthase MnmH [Betaproteobacteria bacterium]